MTIHDEPGARLGGRYRLEDRTRSGDGWTEWKAIDETLARAVAVYTFAPGLPQVAEIITAARAASRIADRRLVQILDVEDSWDRSFVITEWAGSSSLADILVADGPIDPPLAGRIVADVADAIAVAHQAGVAHLRLTPAVVHWSAGSGLKISGLGIDAAIHRVVVDDPVLEDTQGIGCLLYAALTGHSPGPSFPPLPQAPLAASGQPVKPRQLRASVPTVLDEITWQVISPLTGGNAAGSESVAAPLTTPNELAKALRQAVAVAGSPATARSARTPVRDDLWLDPPSIAEPHASRSSISDLITFFRKPPIERQEPVVAQLVGEPGVGKTYAALRAAQELSAEFPGGIRYAIRPQRGPLERPTQRALLIIDEAEGMAPGSLVKLAANNCELLVVSRLMIEGLPGPVFSVAALTSEQTYRFVSDLLAGQGSLQASADQIAKRSQGLPLLAFLMVEEAKRRPDDTSWLANPSLTIPGFLDVSYSRLDDQARKLLRRMAVLRYDDVADAEVAALLLGCSEVESQPPLDAVRALFGGSRLHVDRAVRDFAAERLGDEEPGEIEGLQATMRRARADRYGVLPRSRITRDFWTTDDQLGYRSFADAIAAFIRHRDTRPPLTIGIKGPWGAGKTSLMRMVQQELDAPDRSGGQRRIQLTEDSRKRLRSRWNRYPKPDDRLTISELLSQTDRTPELVGTQALDQTPLRAKIADVPGSVVGWRPTVWFNPWIYQSEEQVWAGMAGEIIDQVASRLATGDRERFWLRLNLARLDREAVRQSIYRLLLIRLIPPLLGSIMFVLIVVPLTALHLVQFGPVATESGALFFTLAALVQIVRFLRQSASGAFGRLLAEPTERTVPQDLADTMASALRDPGYQARAGFLHLVHKDIRRVIKLVATPETPLVVFVDDLDRCAPNTVTQVIEAISLFLAGEFPDCIFVIAMEPDLLAAHVQVAYQDMISVLRRRQYDTDWSTLGWRFLDKIVQLPLSLPGIDHNQYVNSYIRSLLDIPASAIATEGPAGLLKVDSGTTTAAAPPGPAARESAVGPALNDDLIARLEEGIRLRNPNLDDLAEVAATVQAEILGDARSPLKEEAIAAVDKVFGDLYSDNIAWSAVNSALAGLGQPNPREIKRYLNLFRFYTFITQRRRLLDGAPPPTSDQIARLAALVIRWPHLLTFLRSDRNGNTVLAGLEQAAQMSTTQWVEELRNVGIPDSDHRELKEFLKHGDPISPTADLLI